MPLADIYQHIVTPAMSTVSTIAVAWFAFRSKRVEATAQHDSDRAADDRTKAVSDREMNSMLMALVRDNTNVIAGVNTGIGELNKTLGGITETLKQLREDADDTRLDIARVYAVLGEKQPSQDRRRP